MVYVNANRRQHLYPGESALNVGRGRSESNDRGGNTIDAIFVESSIKSIARSVRRSSRLRSRTRPRRRAFRPSTPFLVPRIAVEFLLSSRVLPIRNRDTEKYQEPYKEHGPRLRQRREERRIAVVVVVAVVRENRHLSDFVQLHRRAKPLASSFLPRDDPRPRRWIRILFDSR